MLSASRPTSASAKFLVLCFFMICLSLCLMPHPASSKSVANPTSGCKCRMLHPRTLETDTCVVRSAPSPKPQRAGGSGLKSAAHLGVVGIRGKIRALKHEDIDDLFHWINPGLRAVGAAMTEGAG